MDAGKLVATGRIVAIPFGCIFRGVIKGYAPPLPFVIVTTIVTVVILGGTRMLYSLVEDEIDVRFRVRVVGNEEMKNTEKALPDTIMIVHESYTFLGLSI